MNKKCLFGGTLVAAGLVHGVANAQSIVWLGGTSSNYALDYSDFDPFGSDIQDMAGGWVGSIANDYGSSDTLGDDLSFTALSTATDLPSSFGISFNFGTFSVTDDMIFDVLWDLTAPDFNFSSHVTITDANGVVFDTGANTSGVAQTTLFAGTTYTLDAIIGAANEGNGATFSSFGAFGTPAPSSVSLLALGGLIATRRRR